MNVSKNVKMGADLAANKDYKAIIEAVGLKDKLKNIQMSFREENSREYRLGKSSCKKA